MFDQLSDRLQETLSDVRNRGKLTEADVDKAMREIRLALLEADVNFKVVKRSPRRSRSAASAPACSTRSTRASRSSRSSTRSSRR